MIIEDLPGNHVLLLGIGGSGMSSLAHILLDLGYQVFGYDKKESETTLFLKERGVRIEKDISGFDPDSIDFIVFSSAINDATNGIFKNVKELGKPLFHRSKILHKVFGRLKSISVAGSHGKTSTTAMVSQILETSKKDPSIMIGGDTDLLGKKGGKAGHGEWGVYESDESDGTFLNHTATVRIVTNVDNDHLDYYGDEKTLQDAFLNYLAPHTKGDAIVQAHDLGILKVLKLLSKSNRIDPNFQLWLLGNQDLFFNSEHKDLFRDLSEKFGDKLFFINYQIANEQLLFDFNENSFHLKLPFSGSHYLRNSLCAIFATLQAGIFPGESTEILSSYVGVKRRQETLGIKNSITVMDDYGHHPTEIRTVIESLKQSYQNKGKLVVLFQPHRFTRTEILQKELAEALSHSENLFLLPIYSAGEKEINGISTATIANHFVSKNHKLLSGNMDEDLKEIGKVLKPGDCFLCLGAGNVRLWGESFLKI
ncbi:UDP-N-acetylmuramate--L-alanine ligase [Leptospira sp. 'Mane']|uniref:UDP-N-acetylmuramate--L-alanine ligase n=1 Tax=Leptospira sp. 'Mane' TaxID=3387407 RepID=UPI00398A5C78